MMLVDAFRTRSVLEQDPRIGKVGIRRMEPWRNRRAVFSMDADQRTSRHALSTPISHFIQQLISALKSRIGLTHLC